MAIQASKTCKVWILLNPSMCYSGCFWDTGRHSSVFLKFYRVLMTLLWYSSYWIILPLQHGFSLPFIACFLGLWGTSDFSLLPLRARAVSFSYGLVSSLFFSWFSSFIAVSLKVICWLSIPGRPQQLAFNLSSFKFSHFSELAVGVISLLSLFPNSWNLLLLGWKFSSSCFYVWFSHSWFLVVQLLCSWMFALYFLILCCTTGYLRRTSLFFISCIL